MIEPDLATSPPLRVTGRDSPVRADSSDSIEPVLTSKLQSAGTMSPSLTVIRSPGTNILASIVCQTPSRFTEHLGAKVFLRAEIALPAFLSSKKPMRPL